MNKKGWKEVIENNCRDAKTYQPYFDSVIDTLAQILENRDLIHEEFVKGGSKPTVTRNTERSGKENVAKNPLLILENELNSQALSYWKELGLTPSGLKKINEMAISDSKKQSSLEKALNAIKV